MRMKTELTAPLGCLSLQFRAFCLRQLPVDLLEVRRHPVRPLTGATDRGFVAGDGIVIAADPDTGTPTVALSDEFGAGFSWIEQVRIQIGFQERAQDGLPAWADEDNAPLAVVLRFVG